MVVGMILIYKGLFLVGIRVGWGVIRGVCLLPALLSTPKKLLRKIIGVQDFN